MLFDSPHFRIPFAFSGNSAALVEQDTRADIIQNMWVIASYEVGERDDEPDFGISDQALRENGADMEEIRAAIIEWEPRARPLLEDEPGLLGKLVQVITVRQRESDSG